MNIKKTISLLTAATLVLSLPVQASADVDLVTGEKIQGMYAKDIPADQIDTLDLNLVLDRALNLNYNLNLLALKASAQDFKKQDLETKLDDLPTVTVSGGHLPATSSEVSTATVAGMPQLPATVTPWIIMTNTAVNALVYGAGALAGGINEILSTQGEQYKDAAHQLGTDRDDTYLQRDEAKEGIKLQITNLYIQLLGQQKQIDFMNDYEAVLEKELLRATLLQQQGLASMDDVRNVNKLINKQKDDINILVNNHNLALEQLCLEIRVKYSPTIKLKDIDSIPVERVGRKNTMDLLKNSYQMKIAANNIEESQWQITNSVTSNTYGAAYLGLNGAIAWSKNEQMQLELTKKIEANYTDVDNAYQACLTEQRNLNDLKLELTQMQARYQAGLISKHDLNKFSLKVEQAETSLYAAKLKLYLLSQKAKAMETGAIL